MEWCDTRESEAGVGRQGVGGNVVAPEGAQDKGHVYSVAEAGLGLPTR